MNFKIVRLKAGKEKPILHRHHWIFSGAIAKMPTIDAGDILAVESHSGQLLGYAYFNNQGGSISGRMVSFGPPPLEAIKTALLEAISMRSFLFNESTNAYRLIHGEGDGLPGLIVDKYKDTLVIQISTVGMEKLKSFVVEILKSHLKPSGILEKSLSPARKEEGLKPFQEILMGTVHDRILIHENGLKFFVNPIHGQKTGFFLDQREMRSFVGSLKRKKVLNCFAYTGGFSLYALAGGATHVDSVDISQESLTLAQENCHLNNFQGAHFFAEDVFEFLRTRELNYDLVVLDPPAFAKRAKDVVSACRGYKEINRVTLEKMPPNSILMTSSCSYFVDEKLFQQVIFQAAREAHRNVRIIEKHRQAHDHPVNIFHPEGNYLKSLVLFIA